MRFGNRIWSSVRAMARRSRMEREMDAELRFHIEAFTEDLVRRGVPREEARRRARIEFGGIERAKEECREARGVRLIDSLLQDWRYGARMLRKSPGFTFLAALCLSLGIGVNTAIFTVLDFALLRPLPVNEPDRMTILSRAGDPLIPYPDYLNYHDRSQAFTDLAASLPTESSLEANDETHLAAAEAVSGNYSQTMKVSTALGRWFTDENEPVAVLSYAAWRRFFNGDPGILGKGVRSESQSYTVIGVAPPTFTGIYAPIQTEIWVPLHIWTNQYPDARAHLLDRVHPWPRVMVFGRLKREVVPPVAAANLNSIDASTQPENSRTESATRPLILEIIHGAPSPVTRRDAVPFVTLLFLVVGIVLLIACVNVGNLLLARGVARERELSMRTALGASPGRLLRQLLIETLLLSLLGTLGGLVLGDWTNRLLNALFRSLPLEAQVVLHMDLSLNARVFTFALALSFVCTLFCGLFPAWRAVHRDAYPVLKGGSAPKQRTRLRHLSQVAQVALSLMLLLCSGLFLHSIYRMRATDPGFAVRNHLYMLTFVSAPEFTPATGLQFYAQTLEHLRSLPGVRSAGLTRFLPLTVTGQETDCISIDGSSPSFTATLGVISPGFLSTMQIPVLRGRDFSAMDTSASAPVVLVSQNLAHRLWLDGSAVGQRLRFGCTDKIDAEVVGVVRDTNIRALGEGAQPHFYRPFAQRYTGLATLVVETSTDAATVAHSIRSAVRAESAGVRIFALEPLAAHVERSYWMVRWESAVLIVFGMLALLLAAVGLYGVMAFHAAQRTQEIGLRIALGARSGEVYRLILREGMKITLLGVVSGTLGSVALTRSLSRFLSGLNPADPLTFGGAALLWIGVGLLAGYVPARRATKVDPMVALRYE